MMGERMVLLVRGLTKHGKDSLLKANHAGDMRVVHSNSARGGYASFVSSASTGYSWVSFNGMYKGPSDRKIVFDALSRHKFTKFSFARKLKLQVAQRYSVSLDFIEENKDNPLLEEHIPFRFNSSVHTYRDELIVTAKYERSIDPDVYVRDVESCILENDFVMITDYRNPNEFTFVNDLCLEQQIPFFTVEMIRPLPYTQGEDSPSEHYIDRFIPDIIMCSTEHIPPLGE